MARFGNSWYVRKDRIQAFLPLSDSLSFEIDRTDAGVLSASSGEPEFGTTLGPTSQNGAERRLDYEGSPVSALLFRSGQMKYFSFNDRINEMINNVAYRVGGKATISFWVYASDDTLERTYNVDWSSNPVRLGVASNVILGDVYQEGYTFGFDTQTSVIYDMEDSSIRSVYDEVARHVLTTRNSVVVSSDDYNYELETITDSSQTPQVIPEGQWVLVSYVLDHSSTSKFKTTVHMRYWERTETTGGGTVVLKRHLYKTATGMGAYAIDTSDGVINMTVADRKEGVWNLGCTLLDTGSSLEPGAFFTGAVRNLTIHSVMLSDDQMDKMFENGIDPYVAVGSPNADPDPDQYDKNFWGKYGVMATGSHVRLEKSLTSRLSQSSVYYGSGDALHSRPRFSVAARDLSTLEVARQDVVEGETTNPDITDSANSYNKWGTHDPITGDDITEYDGHQVPAAFQAGSWRGSAINGDSKLSMKNSKAIWGSFINGKTRMMKLEPWTKVTGESGEKWNDPRNLPPGRYITEILSETHAAGTENPGYPPYLPHYYYKDRLGRSWRRAGSTFAQNSAAFSTKEDGTTVTGSKSNVYVDEIFWDNSVQRYERIPWYDAAYNNNGEIVSISSLVADGTVANDTTAKNNVFNNSSDKTQLGFASKWMPVEWGAAIYDIDYGQSLNDGGYGYIKLLLISSDGRFSARYSMYAVSDGNGGRKFSRWHFENFNYDQCNYPGCVSPDGGQPGDQSEYQQEFLSNGIPDPSLDHMANERIQRIFLPHVVIPKLMIPMFHDNVNVDSVNLIDISSSAIPARYSEEYTDEQRVSNIASGVGASFVTTNVYPDEGSLGPYHSREVNIQGQIGYYLIIVQAQYRFSDKGGAKVTFQVQGDPSTTTTIPVGLGVGSGTGRTRMTATGFMIAKISSRGLRTIEAIGGNQDGGSGGILVYIFRIVAIPLTNYALADTGSIVRGVSYERASASTDDRYQNYVARIEGKDYLKVEGVGAKYTRKNYKVDSSNDPINDTLLDQASSQYEE